jgi:hypothetical protein
LLDAALRRQRPPSATMSSAERPLESPADELRERIADALRGLRFGVIEIQVHDSRVVRITRTEKILLEAPAREVQLVSPKR